MKKLWKYIRNAVSNFWDWLDPGFRLFIVILFYAFGLFGGVGACVYCGAWPCAIGVVALAIMAWSDVSFVWHCYNGDCEELKVGGLTDLDDGEYEARGYKIIVKGGVVVDIKNTEG